MNAEEIREWATKILGKVAAKRLDELVVDVLAMQPAPIGSVDIIGGRSASRPSRSAASRSSLTPTATRLA
jgi:hypothetical protein